MSWPGLLFAAVFALALAGYDCAYLAYSRAKLERLKPRPLAARIEWAGDPAAARRLLLIGDSRIAYWPLRPAPGWRMGKIGFPGETAANIEAAIGAALAQARPHAVAIQAGGNDVSAAVFQTGAECAKTLARAVEALTGMGERARAAGAERVIVLTLVPPIAPELWRRALTGAAPQRMAASLGPQIRRQAQVHGFEILDADALFRDADGALRLDYRRDASHWSNAGYEALTAELFKRLERRPDP